MFINISSNPYYRATATATLPRRGIKMSEEISKPKDRHIRIPPTVTRPQESDFVFPPSGRQALMLQREAAARAGLSERRGCCPGRRLRG